MAVTSDGEEISSNATVTDVFEVTETHSEFEQQGENEKSIPKDAAWGTQIQDQKPADGTGMHPMFPVYNMPQLPTSNTQNIGHSKTEEQRVDAGNSALSSMPQRRHSHTVDDTSEPVHYELMTPYTATPVDLEENVSPSPAEITGPLDTKQNDGWDAMYETLQEEVPLGDSNIQDLKQHLPISHDLGLTDEGGYTPLYKAALKGHLKIVEDLISHGANCNRPTKGGPTPLHEAVHEGHRDIVDFLILQESHIQDECEVDQRALHMAGAKGFPDIIKSFIAEGIDVNESDKKGQTPLHEAAGKGHAGIIISLIQAGAIVNQRDARGSTPLLTAINNAQISSVRPLILMGADTSKVNENGDIPLHSAAAVGHTDIVKYITEQESDRNKTDIIRTTSLHLAVRHGHIEIVRHLLLTGTEVTKLNGKTLLYTAARFGHIEIVELLILNGADVNEEDGKGMIPLHGAAISGNIEVMKYLIQKGSDMNKSDVTGRTPFNAAVEYGHIEAVKYLIAKGAKQNTCGGNNPLYIAVRQGDLELSKFFISRGADVNEENHKGRIPLHSAAGRGHRRVMEYLIQQGSEVNKYDAQGWTPFHAAVQNGHLEAVKYLISNGAKQNRYDGMTPLYSAAQSGHVNIAELLVSKGANVNEGSNKGLIPLHGAAAKGHMKVLEFLIKQRSDVNKSDAKGWTPLNAAVKNGHLKVVKYLMANGAKLNRCAGVTPLFAAAQSGHLHIVKFFISEQVDVNEEDEVGQIPLHGAATGGHLEILEYLIQQGSDVNKGDCKGWTPFNAAVEFGHLEAVKYLLANGAKQNTFLGMIPLYLAAQSGHLHIVRFLISNGADVNKEDDEGRITLHGAATRGHMTVMAYLIQQGADVNKMDSKGWTPFSVAARNGHLEAVKLLMANGAQGSSFHGMSSIYIATQSDNIYVAKHSVSRGYYVNERSEKGCFPLHAACYNCNIDIVKYLVDHSAKVNEQDEDGWTPLHISAQEDHPELVVFLLKNGAEIDSNDIGLTPLQVAQNAGHANVMDGVSLCGDGTIGGHILHKDTDTDTEPCVRDPPLQSTALPCDVHLSPPVEKSKDENDYDISEKEGNGISSKYHSAMALDREKCSNEGDNPFVQAKAECLDTKVQDPKVDQNEVLEGPRKRELRLDRLGTYLPEQFDALSSRNYNSSCSSLSGPLAPELNGLELSFLHTSTAGDNGPNKETESSCHTHVENSNDMRCSSSGLATGQDDQEKDSPDVCKSSLSTKTRTVAQEASCEDFVENGDFARLMRERKNLHRSTYSRNYSLLPLVPAILKMAAALTLLLHGNSVLVGATGSHKEVELQAGMSGTIPFHISWPQDDSSYVFPYFTLRFASKQRPFCINGMSDPQGFEYSSQYFKFTTIKYETSSSLSVNLTISDVNALDGTSYVYTVHLYERKQPWSEVMAIKARVLPGPAKCTITATGYSPNLYEAYCNASRGDDDTTITCYQDSDKIPFKDRVRTNGLVTRGVFWVQKDKALSCCSHYVSDEPHQQTCHDFVWHPAETHTPNISNSSLVTRDGVGHHTESVLTIRSGSMLSPNDSSSPSEKILQGIVSVLMISVITLILIQ